MVKATPDVRRLNYGRPDIESGIIERGCFSETSSGKVLENERIDFAVKGNIAR
jgi:hypothetical protein